jgi:1,2-diacylglycerol 3-alpha-glucosyltransferase
MLARSLTDSGTIARLYKAWNMLKVGFSGRVLLQVRQAPGVTVTRICGVFNLGIPLGRRGSAGVGKISTAGMRVGFFTEVYHPIVNGIVAAVDGLAGGLRALGHEVYCFAPRMPGCEEPEGPVYRIPSLPLPLSTPYRLTVPVVSRRNRHAIINRLDLLHAHSPFVTGWMSVRYARRLRIPLVYTYHTRLEEYVHYVPFEPNATRRAASTLTRSFANLADAVIVPTPAMRERLAELGVTARIEVIPSGIDLRKFGTGRRSDALRAQYGMRGEERLFLVVSRLAIEKNIDVLVDALAQCTIPARLAIAGDGPERESLQARAAARGVAERILFLGNVDRDSLPDLYASADAFVFASVTETQGLVLVEALAAGVPVIAADAPQAREVLGEAGRIVPARPEAFASAMSRIPAVPSPGDGQQARAAAERFGIEEQARRVAAVYESLRTRPAYLVGS